MKTSYFLLTALISWALSAAPAYSYDLPSTKAIEGSNRLKQLQAISDGISELSGEAAKSVVFISVSKIMKERPYGAIDPFDFFFGPRNPYPQHRQKKQKAGVGSGFIVDLNKGYIITNNHVIEGAAEISLKLANDKTYIGKVLGTDKNTDVAVVQIKDKNFKRKGLAQLTLGNSDTLAVGSLVLALGAPFGLETSISFGVISAKGRGNLNITNLGNFLQTDAAINPGNSGGPLINMRGEVVGMNTAIYSRSGSSAGIGFAVPSHLVKKIATQLINKGKVARGYLGVQLAQEIDEDIASALNLPKGVSGAIVSRVEPGGPAFKAGLRDGDVISKVDGKTIKNRENLTNTVGLLPAGSKIKIKYYRDGQLKSSQATLAEFPSKNMARRGKGSQKPGEAYAGLTLEPINPKKHQNWISQFSIDSRKGLLVTEVAADSKAAASGIRPGDVLIKANRKSLRSPGDFTKIYKKSTKILIQLERSGTYRFASLRK